MTITTHPRTASVAAIIGVTLAIALVWITYALVRDDTTVHLGPLVVPFVPVATAHGAPRIVALTGFATALAAVVVVVLAATGNLDGPALGPFADATAESLVTLGVSASAALAVALLSRRNAG